MIPFAVLNSLVSDVKKDLWCKLSDDFSGFVDTCGTGKRNRAEALVLGNGRIAQHHVLRVLEIVFVRFYSVRIMKAMKKHLRCQYEFSFMYFHNSLIPRGAYFHLPLKLPQPQLGRITFPTIEGDIYYPKIEA